MVFERRRGGGGLADSCVMICERLLKLALRRIARYRKGNRVRGMNKT